eukprot:2253247-Rhodomonas_salina.1
MQGAQPSRSKSPTASRSASPIALLGRSTTPLAWKPESVRGARLTDLQCRRFGAVGWSRRGLRARCQANHPHPCPRLRALLSTVRLLGAAVAQLTWRTPRRHCCEEAGWGSSCLLPRDPANRRRRSQQVGGRLHKPHSGARPPPRSRLSGRCAAAGPLKKKNPQPNRGTRRCRHHPSP